MKRTEIYQNGEYFAKNPTWDTEDSSWKVKWIKELLDRNDFQFNEVVDLGCGAGKIIDGMSVLYPNVKTWKGYDISPQAIMLANQIRNPRLAFYNEDYLSKYTASTQLLLAIDVIEHVADYYGFLEQMKNKSGHFVFHIPLDLSLRSLLKPHVLLQQREAVGHIHYFSKEMVFWMLNDTGYEIIDWLYTKPMLDLHPQASIKNRIKKLLRNISYALSPDKSVKLWGVYSIMVLAKQK